MPPSESTVEWVHATVPEGVVYVSSLLTLLGDPWLAVPVIALVYWFGAREETIRLYGIVLGGLAVVLVAKATLGLPRPDVGPPVPPADAPSLIRPVYALVVHETGHGLPSGHAATAALLWGGLAIVLPCWTLARRAAVAATVVALVALSRVVLGVHYPVDVVAGALLGAAILLAGWYGVARLERATTVALSAGLGAALLAVAVAGPTGDALAVLGGIVGGIVAWYVADPPRTPFEPSTRGVAVGIAGLVGGFALAFVAGAVVPEAVDAISTTAVLGLVVVGWPAVLDRLPVPAAASRRRST